MAVAARVLVSTVTSALLVACGGLDAQSVPNELSFGSIPDGMDLTGASAVSEAAPRFVFTDVTESSGLRALLAGAYVHTAAWGDADGDGRVDLYVGTFASPRTSGSSRLLFNRRLRFRDSGQASLATSGRATGSVFADFDNDGDLDLFVSNNAVNVARPSPGDTVRSRLFRNDGGIFTDVTVGSGISAQTSNGRQAGVFDADGDGMLDLFIVADNLRGAGSTVLLRNQGGLRFSNVTADAGLPPDIHGLGLAIGDVTGDGWPDIFVAGNENQFQPNDNFMFVSNRDGTFRRLMTDEFDWTPFTNGTEDWVSGAALADLNRDGRPDLVVGHHFGSSSAKGIGTKLGVYVNRGRNAAGDPVFDDVTETAGIPAIVSKQPHVEVQDFDNDGWPDLYVSLLVEGEAGAVPLILANTGSSGDPVFEIPDFISSLDDPLYYAGGPTADFDKDGRMDIFLSEWRSSLGTPSTSVLLRNEGAPRNWLQVLAVGNPGRGENTMGIGAVVTVRNPATGAILGVREITTATGFSSSQPAIAHFGLGSVQRVDITVQMPFGGRSVTRRGVLANQRVNLPRVGS